jgi:hypothetical protein
MGCRFQAARYNFGETDRGTKNKNPKTAGHSAFHYIDNLLINRQRHVVRRCRDHFTPGRYSDDKDPS